MQKQDETGKQKPELKPFRRSLQDFLYVKNQSVRRRDDIYLEVWLI